MKCDKKDLLLYAVTDRHWLNGRTLCEVVKESLDGGVTFVQLREKTLDEGTFLEEAKELQKLGREYIGVEKELDYYLLACKRLEMADTDKSIQGYENNVFMDKK